MSTRPNNPLHDLPPWDPDEHDKAIRAERAKANREHFSALAALAAADRYGHGKPAKVKASPAQRQPSPPRAQPSTPGQADPIYQPTYDTWLMKFTHNGCMYRERFPTEREAIAFRDQIKTTRPEREPEPERDPRLPRPQQRPNGRWRACVRHRGKVHKRTFDTEQEAAEFIRVIKES